MLPQEIFGILTPSSPLSWVSQSFRWDIGQFNSPRKLNCEYLTEMRNDVYTPQHTPFPPYFCLTYVRDVVKRESLV